MRHGAHCRTRSFPTKCKNCNATVLYWECSHGVKIIVEYPVYGKTLKHICKTIKKSKSRSVISHAAHAEKLSNVITFQCPVCGKILENEKSLLNHIKKLKSHDDAHAKFFDEDLDLINFDTNANQSYSTEKLSNNEKSEIGDLTNIGKYNFKIKSKQKDKFTSLLSKK
jgi:uncharacterized C2H2 Zn-finger protein